MQIPWRLEACLGRNAIIKDHYTVERSCRAEPAFYEEASSYHSFHALFGGNIGGMAQNNSRRILVGKGKGIGVERSLIC